MLEDGAAAKAAASVAAVVRENALAFPTGLHPRSSFKGGGEGEGGSGAAQSPSGDGSPGAGGSGGGAAELDPLPTALYQLLPHRVACRLPYFEPLRRCVGDQWAP